MNNFSVNLICAGFGWYGFIAQALGFIALIVGLVSFQAKTRKGIVIIQIISCLAWTAQFIMFKQYTGAVTNALGAVRNFVYSLKDKYKWAQSKAVPAVFIVLFVVAGVLTFKVWYDVLPVIAMVLACISLFISDEKKVRIICLFTSPCWLAYDLIIGSIAGVVNELLSSGSIIIAMIRFRDKKQQKLLEDAPVDCELTANNDNEQTQSNE